MPISADKTKEMLQRLLIKFQKDRNNFNSEDNQMIFKYWRDLGYIEYSYQGYSFLDFKILLEQIEKGGTKIHAFNIAGINYKSFMEYTKEGRLDKAEKIPWYHPKKFYAKELVRVKSQTITDVLNKIKQNKDWKALAYWLKTVHPTEFSDHAIKKAVENKNENETVVIKFKSKNGEDVDLMGTNQKNENQQIEVQSTNKKQQKEEEFKKFKEKNKIDDEMLEIAEQLLNSIEKD